MKPDDLIGVGWLTIEYCKKVTLPVNKLGLMKFVVINNTNDIEFVHSEQNTTYDRMEVEWGSSLVFESTVGFPNCTC